VSSGPFWLTLAAAALTAFYMTRQVAEVFYGSYRGSAGSRASHPHENPRVMTGPLIVLAVFAVLLGFVGTPFWPGFQHFLGAEAHPVAWGSALVFMVVSTAVVGAGLGAGWWFYGLAPRREAEAEDPLAALPGRAFESLRNKFWVDELYEATVVRWVAALGRGWQWLDGVILEGLVSAVGYAALGLAWLSRLLDEYGWNPAFDEGCRGLRSGGAFSARLQDGRVQSALRALALGFAVLLLLLTWGCAS
jgi:NADH-quinone oxidoreductase subunit L